MKNKYLWFLLLTQFVSGCQVALVSTPPSIALTRSATTKTALAPKTETPIPATPTVVPQWGLYRDYSEKPIEVKLKAGFMELSMYNLKTSKGLTGRGPYMVCAVTNNGYLVACPVQSTIVFTSIQVELEGTGIELPPRK